MDWIIYLAIPIIVIAIFASRAKKRWLAKKYDGDPYRNDVLSGTIRQGMTAEHVIDAWGPPEAVDVRVFKSKTVHTYKYARKGARSFRQRVQIENGIVVGWTSS